MIAHPAAFVGGIVVLITLFGLWLTFFVEDPELVLEALAITAGVCLVIFGVVVFFFWAVCGSCG